MKRDGVMTVNVEKRFNVIDLLVTGLFGLREETKGIETFGSLIMKGLIKGSHLLTDLGNTFSTNGLRIEERINTVVLFIGSLKESKILVKNRLDVLIFLRQLRVVDFPFRNVDVEFVEIIFDTLSCGLEFVCFFCTCFKVPDLLMKILNLLFNGGDFVDRLVHDVFVGFFHCNLIGTLLITAREEVEIGSSEVFEKVLFTEWIVWVFSKGIKIARRVIDDLDISEELDKPGESSKDGVPDRRRENTFEPLFAAESEGIFEFVEEKSKVFFGLLNGERRINLVTEKLSDLKEIFHARLLQSRD